MLVNWLFERKKKPSFIAFANFYEVKYSKLDTILNIPE